ncbi:hypothetical protein K8I28_14440, partial [bacterium]|nr:hypothetical protein [bacterium]
MRNYFLLSMLILVLGQVSTLAQTGIINPSEFEFIAGSPGWLQATAHYEDDNPDLRADYIEIQFPESFTWVIPASIEVDGNLMFLQENQDAPDDSVHANWQWDSNNHVFSFQIGEDFLEPDIAVNFNLFCFPGDLAYLNEDCILWIGDDPLIEATFSISVFPAEDVDEIKILRTNNTPIDEEVQFNAGVGFSIHLGIYDRYENIIRLLDETNDGPLVDLLTWTGPEEDEVFVVDDDNTVIFEPEFRGQGTIQVEWEEHSTETPVFTINPSDPHSLHFCGSQDSTDIISEIHSTTDVADTIWVLGKDIYDNPLDGWVTNIFNNDWTFPNGMDIPIRIGNGFRISATRPVIGDINLILDDFVEGAEAAITVTHGLPTGFRVLEEDTLLESIEFNALALGRDFSVEAYDQHDDEFTDVFDDNQLEVDFIGFENAPTYEFVDPNLIQEVVFQNAPQDGFLRLHHPVYPGATTLIPVSVQGGEIETILISRNQDYYIEVEERWLFADHDELNLYALPYDENGNQTRFPENPDINWIIPQDFVGDCQEAEEHLIFVPTPTSAGRAGIFSINFEGNTAETETIHVYGGEITQISPSNGEEFIYPQTEKGIEVFVRNDAEVVTQNLNLTLTAIQDDVNIVADIDNPLSIPPGQTYSFHFTVTLLEGFNYFDVDLQAAASWDIHQRTIEISSTPEVDLTLDVRGNPSFQLIDVSPRSGIRGESVSFSFGVRNEGGAGAVQFEPGFLRLKIYNTVNIEE